MNQRFFKCVSVLQLLVVLLTLCTLELPAAADNGKAASLDLGYRDLYELDFAGAQSEFSAWGKGHPDNPLGPVSEGAGLLFSEFNRLGILQAQFYASDTAFASRKKLTPDTSVRDEIYATLDRSESLSRVRLGHDPKDRDALFAMTLASGLRADYAALIEKRNLASLHYTRDASNWANQLLAVDPSCYDAHLGAGISKYITGTMAAPVRWFLRLGGVSADKQAGMAELQLTAAKGHYLAPFARILLAIAYVREKDIVRARELLESLHTEFPANPLFAQEIARLEATH
ncbi:MAG TPA: hypothetical protein VFA89_21935 [Terriglobales bacterium]|nr:hypothetical protein [Terriglobales bacterium]